MRLRGRELPKIPHPRQASAIATALCDFDVSSDKGFAMMPHHSLSLFEALPCLPGNARSRVIGTAAASGEVLADDDSTKANSDVAPR
jgi:hypothetical protein